ncbi:MAG: hypothetical protein AAF693_19040 [Bacteroidota bacterium]
MKGIIDFGLVILIWLVQLIIYPSFQYIDKAQISEWHSKYTVLITIVVMPLMFGQVAFHILSLFKKVDTLGVVQAALIAVVWAITFLKAVPLHNRIQSGVNFEESVSSLIQWNWPRTIIWTLIFCISFWQYKVTNSSLY